MPVDGRWRHRDIRSSGGPTFSFSLGGGVDHAATLVSSTRQPRRGSQDASNTDRFCGRRCARRRVGSVANVLPAKEHLAALPLRTLPAGTSDSPVSHAGSVQSRDAARSLAPVKGPIPSGAVEIFESLPIAGRSRPAGQQILRKPTPMANGVPPLSRGQVFPPPPESRNCLFQNVLRRQCGASREISWCPGVDGAEETGYRCR